MENDINFIEWLCSKGNGWSTPKESEFYKDYPNLGMVLDYKLVVYLGFSRGYIHHFVGNHRKDLYRLLLQDAFEGVMNESDEDIYLTKNCIKIYSLGDKEKFFTTEGYDHAKESFLKYKYKESRK